MISEQFMTEAAALGFDLSPEHRERFAFYHRLLCDWNQRMNLTAITDPREVEVKHFLDSLLLLKAVDPPPGAEVIDVGTGAGFPGVPVKVLRPDLRLTLMDSLQKRVNFLEALSDALDQPDNWIVHGRAEELGRRPEFREQYHLATARAVAALPALCEYCLPLVRVGGLFAALKGGEIEQEAVSAQKAISLLGGKLGKIEKFTLPGGHRRSIVLVEKISQTPPKYPRAAVKITKAPL